MLKIAIAAGALLGATAATAAVPSHFAGAEFAPAGQDHARAGAGTAVRAHPV